MTEKQYDLCERMENEYADYIDALLKEGKQTIISMSDKTTFFAQMLSHVKERDLLQTIVNALQKTVTPLNDLLNVTLHFVIQSKLNLLPKS